jgi:putative transposase
MMTALYQLLLALVRVAGARLERRRIVDDGSKALLLRAVDRSRAVLPLRSALRVIGLSSSRHHSWSRELSTCDADASSCPRTAPNQLTVQEVLKIKEMVTDPEYRHVPTGRLALLAQRLGTVVASPSTWYRLIREHRWRRLRQRVHPGKPKVGLRTERPNEAWHVDTTVIRLLDGTKLYLHGVIDSFSRKILAWRLAAGLRAATAAAVLRDAVQVSSGGTAEHRGVPMIVVDGGVENFNGEVDEIVVKGLLQRVRAQTEQLTFSNSPIESFWRSLKHQWLYLNTLDTQSAVEKLVRFYVDQHNDLPHLAFSGQTPNEMYAGTGDQIPSQLAAAKAAAKQTRLAANRATTCDTCPQSRQASEAEASSVA